MFQVVSVSRAAVSSSVTARRPLVSRVGWLGMFVALWGACGGDGSGTTEAKEGACELKTGAADVASLPRIGCKADFLALASEPLDSSIPGARSGKVVLDQRDKDTLYFQNSVRYKIHYDFASKNLSGGTRPTVTSLFEFNQTQYYAPDRRFILGAVTYYEGPKVWALEMAPYDTATADMIEKLFMAVKSHAYFGSALYFHPTSEATATEAKNLPASVPVKTTDELYAAIDYQPLNLGESVGKLRFLTSEQLATEYLGFRDIVVLDKVPNDISVVSGMITEEFQTPLSHVNVLAQNRKTPNMGLRKATTNKDLRALDGKWVRFRVGSFDWSMKEATLAEADAYWEEHKPKGVTLPELDTSVKELRNLEDVTPEPTDALKLRDAIKLAVRSYGAKSAHYSILTRTTDVPIKKAFGIPVYYYVQFMETNGFYARVKTLLADTEFRDKPAVREAALKQLRDDMKKAPVDAAFQALLKAKLEKDFPNQTIRFRSSTNGEDLDGFPCAGCYDSKTGDPKNWEGDLLDAVKSAWATVWKFRTFEERSYHSIDHLSLAMALLVHHNFPDEEANGVAITANPYDPSGLAPGFYINVQHGGDAEVVAPPPGVTSDSFIYQYSFQGQPILYLTRSNIIPAGTTVLTTKQVFQLGKALDAIHKRFSAAYGPAAGVSTWYSMDVEFKFDDEAAPGQEPTLYIKQARPYAGRGQ